MQTANRPSFSDSQKKGFRFKKLGALFSRSVVEETKTRTLSLPSIHLEEEEGEFWEVFPDPIYQNIDCISLNRYQISSSDSESESEYDYCDHSLSVGENKRPDCESSLEQDNIYADPDNIRDKRSDSLASDPAEHQYTDIIPEINTSRSLSVLYKNICLKLPENTENQVKSHVVPVYHNKPEDLLLPVFSKSRETVTFTPVTFEPVSPTTESVQLTDLGPESVHLADTSETVHSAGKEDYDQTNTEEEVESACDISETTALSSSVETKEGEFN